MKKLVSIRQGLGIDVSLKEDVALIDMGIQSISIRGQKVKK